MGLNAAGTAEHADATIENLQRTVNLDGEVNVTRGIDDVELVLVPEAGGGSGLNGDPALCFLFHEVRRCCAFVNFTDFVDFTGELQNSFSGGGFASIDVSEDADISITSEIFHKKIREVETSVALARSWENGSAVSTAVNLSITRGLLNSVYFCDVLSMGQLPSRRSQPADA